MPREMLDQTGALIGSGEPRRWRVSHKCGDVFEENGGFDGLALTIEVASLDEAYAHLSAFSTSVATFIAHAAPPEIIDKWNDLAAGWRPCVAEDAVERVARALYAKGGSLAEGLGRSKALSWGRLPEVSRIMFREEARIAIAALRAEPPDEQDPAACSQGHDCPEGPHGACCGEPDADLILRFERQTDGSFLMVADGEWMGVLSGETIEELLDVAKAILPEARRVRVATPAKDAT